MMKTVGIDLAGLQTNASGFAVLFDRRIQTRLVYLNQEIIELCVQNRPELIAIDAPLSWPKCGNLRKADRLLMNRGFRVLPPLFGGMKSLTKRGGYLIKKLQKEKIDVIEVHPTTSGKILFNTSDREKWVKGLKRLGFQLEKGKSRHEVDASMAAFTAALHLKGKTEKVGNTKEGEIIVPLPKAVSP